MPELPRRVPLPPSVQSPLAARRLLQQYQSGRIPTGAVTASPSPVTKAREETRTVLGDMQQILSLLVQREQQDTPEFQQVKQLYQQLSDSLHKARPAPPTATPSPMASPLPPTSELLSMSVQPIKATLGAAGRPGVVSSGPEVKAMQLLLGHQGYQLPATGIFDSRTLAIVRQFQQEKGLPVTGLVGADMRRLLNAALAPG